MPSKLNTLIKYSIFLITVTFVVSCGGNKTTKIDIPPPIIKTKVPTPFDDLTGIWQQQGYGFIYEINKSDYIRYEYSTAHCLIGEQGSLEDLSKIMRTVNKNENGESFTFITHFTLTEFYFDKQDNLPQVCNNISNNTPKDPVLNFDAFWHTLNEQYAFFEVRDIDWLEQYQIYSPQVNSSTSDQELFNLMVNMMKPLNDAHTRLGNGVTEEYALSSRVPLIADFENQNQFSTIGEFVDHLTTVFNNTISNYLGDSQKFAGNNRVNWGDLSNSVGYIAIEAMTDFGGQGNTDFEGPTETEQVEMINTILDTVFTDLQDKTHIVLDLRANGGGSDAVAAAVASRFYADNRLAFSKKARFSDGFTPTQEVYLQPVDQHNFLGSLIILTSTFSASATDNFLLAMLDRDNHIRIGQTSAGIHSDTLLKLLPNGWRFSLSNEVFQAPSGEIYEGKGVSPHLEMVTFTLASQADGNDAILDYIIDNY